MKVCRNTSERYAIALARGSFQGIAVSLQAVLLPLAIIIFTAGWYLFDFDIMLAGVACLFAANVLYACLNLRDRLLFLFLHAGIALFLLSRPLIAEFDEKLTWELSSPEATFFALAALFISLACCFIGDAVFSACVSYNKRRVAQRAQLRPTLVCDALQQTNQQGTSANEAHASEQVSRHKSARLLPMRFSLAGLTNTLGSSEKVRCLRVATALLFIICLVGALAEGAILVAHMRGMHYEEFYLTSTSDYVPWSIDLLKVMLPYMLCGYLATLPRRRPATLALVAFIITAIPMLMIGSRADFVIDVLFAALYYVLRQIIDTDERWITRRVVIAAVVLIPVGVFALGMMDYIRSDKANPEFTFARQIVDALYKQGVSFTILGHGFDVNEQIQDLGFKFYSMGGVITNFTQGFIGTTFFGFHDLGSANSPELALYGNSYAHAMSYFAHPNYLGGEGYGSSYLLELYADFGYGGIAVGSFIISFCLGALSRSIGRSWFWGMIALISSQLVFHMPRGYAGEWIDFMITTRFLLAVVLIICLAALVAFAMRGWVKDRAAYTPSLTTVAPRLSGKVPLHDTITASGLAVGSRAGAGHLVGNPARGTPATFNSFGIPLVSAILAPKQKR